MFLKTDIGFVFSWLHAGFMNRKIWFDFLKTAFYCNDRLEENLIPLIESTHFWVQATVPYRKTIAFIQKSLVPPLTKMKLVTIFKMMLKGPVMTRIKVS